MKRLISITTLAVAALFMSCSSVSVTKTTPTVDVPITTVGVYNKSCHVSVIEVHDGYLDLDVTARVELTNNTPYNARVDVLCTYRESDKLGSTKIKKINGVRVSKYSTVLVKATMDMRAKTVSSPWTHCMAQWHLQK